MKVCHFYINYELVEDLLTIVKMINIIFITIFMNNFIFMVLCGSLILNINITYIIYMKYLKKQK